MTKAELINEISISTGFDKKTITVIVESFIKQVKGNLVKGENVYIRGFGSFITRTRAAKMARDIWKENTIAIPAHKIPDFKPAAELKEAVRGSK